MYSRLQNKTPNDETWPDGSKTETSHILTAPIPASYGSTPVEDKSARRFYVPRCGLIFYVMAFIGRFCMLSLRETLSVAIVAIVNHTATPSEAAIGMSNAGDQAECPRDPEVEHERGEFNWDRNQEAIVLSAFYYGFAVTQVINGFVRVRQNIVRAPHVRTFHKTRPASADSTARRNVLPIGVGPFAFRYQGTELPPGNILIPLERQLIALQLSR